MSARHLPPADELWQDMSVDDRQRDPGYWVYTVALEMDAPWHYVSALELLNRAHDRMFAAVGKAFSVLTGERYFSLGNPGCRGRLNSARLNWERTNSDVRIVCLPPLAVPTNSGAKRLDDCIGNEPRKGLR